MEGGLFAYRLHVGATVVVFSLLVYSVLIRLFGGGGGSGRDGRPFSVGR